MRHKVWFIFRVFLSYSPPFPEDEYAFGDERTSIAVPELKRLKAEFSKREAQKD